MKPNKSINYALSAPDAAKLRRLLKRYTKWRNQTMEKVDWHKNDIDDGTIITDSYKTTQNVRRYFKSKFGEQFKFDRDFMQWMKNSVGLTMGDASQEWIRRQDSK